MYLTCKVPTYSNWCYNPSHLDGIIYSLYWPPSYYPQYWDDLPKDMFIDVSVILLPACKIGRYLPVAAPADTHVQLFYLPGPITCVLTAITLHGLDT